jgi:hypothetical protein
VNTTRARGVRGIRYLFECRPYFRDLISHTYHQAIVKVLMFYLDLWNHTYLCTYLPIHLQAIYDPTAGAQAFYICITHKEKGPKPTTRAQ